MDQQEKIVSEIIEEDEHSGDFSDIERLEDRVKLLSPGRLVLKRFFRSKLSVIGLCTLIFCSRSRLSDPCSDTFARSYGGRTKSIPRPVRGRI